MNVPKEMQKTYEEISKILIDYSTEYLSKEYEELLPTIPCYGWYL